MIEIQDQDWSKLLTFQEFNPLKNEIQNVILRAGITLDENNSFQLQSVLNKGFQEWNYQTTYKIGDIVKKIGTYEIYASITNNNLNNALPNRITNTNWEYLQVLKNSISIGSIIMHGGYNIPYGYLLCDGSEYSQSLYPGLHGIIWQNFGATANTFYVPDLRGIFVRGLDEGAGRDPDSATRTAMNPGGLAGDYIGSIQEDSFKSHSHQYETDRVGSSNSGTGNDPAKKDFSIVETSLTGGGETRPKNANLRYIIRYL